MIIEALSKTFEKLEDPRSSRNQRHPFLSLMSIGLLATIAGQVSFSGMSEFAECHEEELSKFIPMPYGPPSHDTLQRLFDGINPEVFIECFMIFTDHLTDSLVGLTALDGKTIRNSGREHPLHIVSAWCEENKLVLGHVKARMGGGEIEALEELLRLLDLKNRIITLDAIGCNRAIKEQIVEGGGDYVIALKRNQGNLHEDVQLYFDDLNKFEGTTWQEWDKGHGRIEHRESWAIQADTWLTSHHAWKSIQSLAMVISTRIIGEKESHDTRFYISSLPADAESICKIARRHWALENKLHWVLDVSFNEDKSCIRNDNAAENIDIMKKWALNSINSQRKKDVSIKSIQRRSSMSIKYLTQLLLAAFHV